MSSDLGDLNASMARLFGWVYDGKAGHWLGADGIKTFSGDWSPLTDMNHAMLVASKLNIAVIPAAPRLWLIGIFSQLGLVNAVNGLVESPMIHFLVTDDVPKGICRVAARKLWSDLRDATAAGIIAPAAS